MSIATRHEIEYLRSRDRDASDPRLLDEMEERLEALRKFDQCISESDWHPHASGLWPIDSTT
jgi:hypothetical protein